MVITASDLRDDKRVKGLRAFNLGGPVTVRDANTLKIKHIITNPPNFETIISTPGSIRQRIQNKRERKEVV